MESISAPPRPSGRSSRAADDDKASSKPKHAPVRTTPYKEKFQALRDRYNKVMAENAERQKDLEALQSQMKDLQAENDLLLDSINLAEPDLINLAPSNPNADLHATLGGEASRPSVEEKQNHVDANNPRNDHPQFTPTNGNLNGHPNPLPPHRVPSESRNIP